MRRRSLFKHLITIAVLLIVHSALGQDAHQTGASPAEMPTTAPQAADQKQMESWWEDLKEGEPAASRALLNFSARPTQAVAFFKGKLKPLKITPEQVQDMVIQLGSDNEAVWKPAFDELEYLDPRLAIDLEPLMDGVKESPARQRLVALLSDRPPETFLDKTVTLRHAGDDAFNFFDGRGSWWAENQVSRLNATTWTQKKSWNRAVRAIVLLQHIGTPDAIAILKNLASGNPDAQPTQVAKAALEGF